MSAKNHNFASGYPKSLNPEVRMLREHPKLLASQHVHSCLQHWPDRWKPPTLLLSWPMVSECANGD